MITHIKIFTFVTLLIIKYRLFSYICIELLLTHKYHIFDKAEAVKIINFAS